MVLSLEAGAIDYARLPLLNDYVRLQSNAAYTAAAHPASGEAYVIILNCTIPQFKDKRVRQAMSFALNRQRFVDSVLRGQGKAQTLVWPATSPAWDAAKDATHKFDLDRARQLLQQAGATNLEVDIVPSGSDPSGKALAEMFQADLASIGVKVNIRNLDTAAARDVFIAVSYQGMYITAQSAVQLAPGTVLGSAVIRPANNRSGFASEAWTKLVADVQAETDTAKLKTLYGQVNDMMLDEMFAIYPSQSEARALMAKKVKDVKPLMWGGAWSLTDAWLEA
jgi:peptide/nickel transport system substrate-binding protein